jgi:hypothetical protein
MVWPSHQARADLALETETARVVAPGRFELSSAFEFQNASDGQEYAVPMAFEFGVIDRLEVLIEPVAFTSIQHKSTSPASGLGDLEATATYLVLKENDPLPAIAFAGEVKFPTATNRQIGSGKYDYRLYAIASKRIGDFDLHFNLGYNIIGAPKGSRTQNPIDAEFGFEWFLNPKFDLFGEVTYVGSSIGASSIASESGNRSRDRAAGEGTGGALVTSEVAGVEIVGSLGVRYHLTPTIDVFGSFSYDNNDAKLFRTGITFKF